jgi:hypothetical protein
MTGKSFGRGTTISSEEVESWTKWWQSEGTPAK